MLSTGSLPVKFAVAPFAAIPIKDQVRTIAARAQSICQTAGADLANLVRLQLFLTDLTELAPAIEAWSDALDGLALPLSAIEVDWLPVRGFASDATLSTTIRPPARTKRYIRSTYAPARSSPPPGRTSNRGGRQFHCS